ncbi:MAG: TSUP family transporter [Sandaracinaceae bacterium]|nr:MAG: hypothetical protein EVA89_07890 [Sandaracinaceae bacterium]HBQ18701.1 hypothetical protein [Myxococcales bacterium]
MTTLVAALLGLAALLAAALSAMTGVGGGVLLLSGLLLVVPATAVVPLHGAVQTAAGLTRIAAFWRHVRWEIVGRFVLLLLPGSLVGILIVGWLASVSPTLLEVLLAVAILASLFAKRVPSPKSATSLRAFYLFGFCTGLLGVVVGSTGPLVSQALLLYDVKKEAHVATKAVVQTVGHALKIPLFGLALSFEFGPWAVPLALMIAGVFVGTWVGKHLLSKISERGFATATRALMILVALQILGGVLWGVVVPV